MKNLPFVCFLFSLFIFPQLSLASQKDTDLPWLSLLLSGNVSLGGSISIASGLVVDNDVNDRHQNGPKNDPGDEDMLPGAFPQLVPSPVTIAGYVNKPGKGSAGSSSLHGDLDDYYRVDLKTGQTLTLSIADHSTGDLDLHLYNSAGDTIVDSSTGTGKTEQLIITTDDTYIVDVFAFSGFSNYSLVIGQDTGGAGISGLSLSDEFIPGEAVVRMESELMVAGGVQTVTSAAIAASVFNMTAKAGAPDRNMLWSLDTSLKGIASVQFSGEEENSSSLSKRQFISPDLLDKYDTLMAIKRLRKRNGIKYADPNYIVKTAAVPNDPHYQIQYHYPLINLPEAWDITTGIPASGQVVVAVVDTGVLRGHEDLQGKLLIEDGYDFILNPNQALDGNGLDNDADDPGDRAMGNSSSFHGTHVAGTIAAASNNNKGVAGVSWGAKIMPLRVLGLQGGTSYDIGQACLYAAQLTNDSGTIPSVKADIINMSIQGYGSFSQADQAVYTQVRNAGVIIIACSGNKNKFTTSYPGSYDGVVSVASVDMEKNRAPYSNFHTTVDVAAPGGDSSVDRNGDGYQDGVLSTGGDDSSGTIRMNYRFMQGTSMASPHMAGVVALMEAVSPGDLTPQMLDDLLISGKITEDIGTAGRDNEFGYGLINAYKAVLEAKGTATAPDPRLAVSPADLNFGTRQTTASLAISNSGGGTLSIQGVTDDKNWLTVFGSGLGTYVATVTRSGLAPGTYSATITVDSDANDETVSVIMSVPDSSISMSANAGYHYVLLIDTDEKDISKQVVEQYNVVARNGVYSYRFNGVKSGGNYRIIAGTDFNNDSYICDAGEACGAYLTLSQQLVLEDVSSSKSDLNFITGFRVQLTPAVGAKTEPFRGWPLLKKSVVDKGIK